MMSVIIEIYNRKSGEKVNEMEKSFGQYSEWLQRAVKREYTIMDYKTCVWVVGEDSWKHSPNDFRVIVK